MITVYMTHQEICKVAIWQMFQTFCRCVFLLRQFWYGLKGGRHKVFKAANLPVNWLKIPKSVNINDFPLSSF